MKQVTVGKTVEVGAGTGSALRRRKSGVVTVVDPDAEVKKT